MASLVALAHAALFLYTIAAVWALRELRGASGFTGPLHVGETCVFVALVGLAAAFLLGIHAVVALRWSSFAMNIGLALGGLLIGIVLVESELRNFYPWSLPAAVENVSLPLLFGMQGRAGPAHVAALVVASSLACLAVVTLGIAWLCRRDVP
jgi:hypothetical protein